MKKFIKITAIFLSFLILFSSCGGGGNEDPKNPSGENNNGTNSTHKEIVTELSDNFVENGNTDYVIVIPDDATSNEKFASQELSLFLTKSTGIEFVIVKESSAKKDKMLSVGQTKAFKSSGIKADVSELGSSGYVVKTVGKSVYMSGAEDLGTIFSVYKFLEKQIGYTYYSYDCIKYDNITSAKLKGFDVIDVPDFEQRYISTRNVWDYKDRTLRLRLQMPYIDSLSSLGHNAQYIINYSTYGQEHPDWFVSATALCYSAGESLENEVANHFIEVLQDTPYESGKNIFLFGQSDSAEFCTCKKCSDAVKKYGSITATMIMFMNKVSDKVQAWIDENQQGRKVYFAFYAYQWSQQPPVQYDKSTGTYTYSQDVVMRDNVGVKFAPVYRNYYLPIESLEEEKICIDSWAQITKNIHSYDYYQNYSYAMYLFNNFDSQVADYKYYKKLGVKYVFSQDFTWVDGWQTFSAYKNYITSNLMWNSEVNTRELTVDFFNNYYGTGAPYVLKYFDEWKSQYAVIYKKYDLKGTIYETMNKPEYWPMSLLEKWINYMDEAFSAIERYKYVDKDLYNTLYNHILMEKTTLQYRMIELYGVDYYKSNEIINVKTEVLTNMGRFNMISYETSSAYSNLMALADNWGISLN